MSDNKRIIVALDYAEQNAAMKLVEQLDPTQCRLKIGKEMFTRFGPELVCSLQQRKFEIFLDLKFHDIPTTVARAVRAAAELGVWMVNVHASGGEEMMRAARNALSEYSGPAPLLTAVTVLTSMNQEQLAATGVRRSLTLQVETLARLAQSAGLDGVVCSAREAGSLRQFFGRDFLLVTPGIRPDGTNRNDQKRVVTPAMAMANGSDFLVIGRPITQAEDPLAVLRQFNREIAATEMAGQP